jgi:hypothetical protein
MARIRLIVPPRTGELVGELRIPGGVGTFRAASANCDVDPCGGVEFSSGVSRKLIELLDSRFCRSTLPISPRMRADEPAGRCSQKQIDECKHCPRASAIARVGFASIFATPERPASQQPPTARTPGPPLRCS